jgi:hypothetical protein
MQFKKIDDYLEKNLKDGSKSSQYTLLKEFKQSRSFVYPLRMQETLASHDPIDYITGALAKPKAGELVVFQLLMSPYRSRRAAKIRRKLMQGKDPKLAELTSQNILSLGINFFIFVSTAFVEALEFTLNRFFNNVPPISKYKQMSNANINPNSADQELRKKMLAKLSEPLFYVDLRYILVVSNERQAKVRLNSLTSSLATFNEQGYQQLVPSDGLLAPLFSRLPKSFQSSDWGKAYVKFHFNKFKYRLPALITSNSCVFSTSEIAGLYHFPYGQTGSTENVVANLSRTLPAPVALKANADSSGFDIVLGRNQHHGTITPIGLTLGERERHIYIIGGTGNGKTTMLMYGIVQDMKAGKGLAIVDPH